MFQTASCRIKAVYFLRGYVLRKPSMCSNKSSGIFCHIGSKIKSIPSRRANFAAGTKSESPETNTIRSACFLSVIDAISKAMRISTPFCLTSIITSFSVISCRSIRPLSRLSITSVFNRQRVSWSDNLPKRSASFRCLINSLWSSFLKTASSDLEKSINFLEMGLCIFFCRGAQS